MVTALEIVQSRAIKSLSSAFPEAAEKVRRRRRGLVAGEAESKIRDVCYLCWAESKIRDVCYLYQHGTQDLSLPFLLLVATRVE
jgi:hypothetical protein